MSKFYAIEAAPAKETKPVFNAPSEIFHLSIIAIPAGSQGHATLYATIDGSTFAVATVDSAKGILQVTVDMILPASQKPVLTVKGNTKLHLSGYVDDMNEMGGAPADDEEDFSDDGDSEEDESEGSDNELPVTKATKALEAKNEGSKAAPAKSAGSKSVPQPAESEDDEEDFDDMDLDEEDMDGLDEEDMSLGDMEEFDEEDFDSEEDDESDDEEVAAPPAAKARAEGNGKSFGVPQGKPQQGKAQQGSPRASGQKYGRV